MTETVIEKQYLDSLFSGVSVDSLPIKDASEKFFVTKNLKITLDISKEQLKQACEQLDCSDEKFFMGAYGLLLARFSGSDEVFFTATGAKKNPAVFKFDA